MVSSDFFLYLTARGFSQIQKLMFENNIFKFKDIHFVQIIGIAIIYGCISGPSLANLLVYLLEKNWITIHRPLLYYRFIDDILMALIKPLDILLIKSQSLNLKLNICDGKMVNFLDQVIWYDT